MGSVHPAPHAPQTEPFQGSPGASIREPGVREPRAIDATPLVLNRNNTHATKRNNAIGIDVTTPQGNVVGTKRARTTHGARRAVNPNGIPSTSPGFLNPGFPNPITGRTLKGFRPSDPSWVNRQNPFRVRLSPPFVDPGFENPGLSAQHRWCWGAGTLSQPPRIQELGVIDATMQHATALG